jgi:hypothetical protein
MCTNGQLDITDGVFAPYSRYDFRQPRFFAMVRQFQFVFKFRNSILNLRQRIFDIRPNRNIQDFDECSLSFRVFSDKRK